MTPKYGVQIQYSMRKTERRRRAARIRYDCHPTNMSDVILLHGEFWQHNHHLAQESVATLLVLAIGERSVTRRKISKWCVP